ncbi:MAG: glutamate--tRNA ligase [Candidatus Moranbacteria bacterium CG06_land_8_20_14_3_00_40_12]|nr:MAG: glutamate--tRNA ligase [Candidatus Moranbacteria bacterium CG23_combo_of_CG06-09_8_20_14_all_40_16]PIU80657.1 MAG: glutamate--tRNA ligase [Candidatus Moranbacteria bacterium CG06_land_8_20_14_3_00_40_12]
MSDKKIRVRFAPSPTGYMHIGNFRTALYAYLFAKKNGGDFILRIEDTDKNRQVNDAIEKIINILNWAELTYSEGVFVNSKSQFPISNKIPKFKSQNYKNLTEAGDYGPYIQSERLDIYKKYAQELLEKDHAYCCFCAPERLEKMRDLQTARKKAPMYDRTCLKLSKEEVAEKLKNGEPYVIRQKINTEGFTEFDDLIRGKVKIKNDLLDDQVLLKSDGYPTYNFANVVDDHLMGITHVMRGEEYISSTPKYTQLYQNFGWIEPKIAHLPLILNLDKTKLSKRQGDVAVEDYIQKGYLKEAIINFVALLGWNPGEGSTQEIFSLEELISEFDLKKVHKAGAVFDLKKLDWINAQYIKKLSIEELYEKSAVFFRQKDFYQNAPEEKKSEAHLKKVLTIEQDRLENLSQVGENNRFFFQDIQYSKELLRWKKMSDEDLKKSLEKSKAVLEKITETDWTKENLEKNLLEVAGEKRGDLLWPLRAALTGAQKSPSPFECAWVLGQGETLKRIGQALNLL